jgi:hypothetical protein
MVKRMPRPEREVVRHFLQTARQLLEDLQFGDVSPINKISEELRKSLWTAVRIPFHADQLTEAGEPSEHPQIKNISINRER